MKHINKLMSIFLSLLMIALLFGETGTAQAADISQAKLYPVDYGSPAIPMNSGTKLKLSELKVQFSENGEYISGDKIKWENRSDDRNLILDSLQKTVSVYAKGVYPLTAAYGDSSQSVYVVAKSPEETEFVLFNDDFSSDTTALIKSAADGNDYRNPDWSKWNRTLHMHTNAGDYPYLSDEYKQLASANTESAFFADYEAAWGNDEGSITAASWLDSASVQPSGAPEVHYIQTMHWFLYLDPTVEKWANDFSDYTVSVVTDVTDNAVGTMGRISGTESGKMVKGNSSCVISAVKNTGEYSFGGSDTMNCFNDLHQDRTKLTKITAELPLGCWQEQNLLSTVFDGDTAVLSYCGKEIAKLSRLESVKGTVGIYGCGTPNKIDSFKVTLNTSKIPPATVITEYTVNFGSPAIPMNSKTTVDLKEIKFQLEKDGEYISGDSIDWTLESNTEGIELNADKTLAAYRSGVYLLKAARAGICKNFYAVVKESSDTEFVLFKDDFESDTTVSSVSSVSGDSVINPDWSIWNKTVLFYIYANEYEKLSETYKKICIPGSANAVFVNNEAAWGNNPGFITPGSFRDSAALQDGVYKDFFNGTSCFLYLDETAESWVKDFSDYTVSVKMSITGRASGPIGRMTALTDGNMVRGVTRAVFGVLDNTGTVSFGGKDTNQCFNDMHYSWQAASKLTPEVINAIKDSYSSPNWLSTQYSGTVATLSYAGQTVGTCTNLPEDTGTVGVYGFNDIDAFKVTLNSTEMPAAVNNRFVAENNEFTMKVNSRIWLDDVIFDIKGNPITGDKIEWESYRKDSAELNSSFKQFGAYRAGKYYLEGHYGDESLTAEVTVSESPEKTPHSCPLVAYSGNGSGKITIKPGDGEAFAYTATVSPDAGSDLRVLTLYNGDNQLTAPTTSAGNVFGFTAGDLSEINLSAEFIKLDGEANFRMMRPSLTKSGSGICFGIRIGNIKNNVKRIMRKITVDGKTYQVDSMGSLLAPESLLSSSSLDINTDGALDTELTEYTDSTDCYLDCAVTLDGIPEDCSEQNIYCRFYIRYQKSDTEYGYVYSDTVCANIKAMKEATNVKITGEDAAKISFSGDTVKNALSYSENDTVTFKVSTLLDGSPVSGVHLKWELYQDGDYDAESKTNLPTRTGYAVSDAFNPLTVSITPNKGYDCGAVYLKVQACTETGIVYNAAKIFCGGALFGADKLTLDTLKPENFDSFWESAIQQVNDFFKDKDLNVSLAELNAVYQTGNGNEKIMIRPADPNISGYDRYSSSYYCYELRVEFGSTDQKAASGFFTVPKTPSSDLSRGINFAGYNTATIGSLYAVPNTVQLIAETHGIRYEDEDYSRTDYVANYEEKNFAHTLDGLSEEELASVSPENVDIYHMYLRNLYLSGVLKRLNISDNGYGFDGNLTAYGGSMGGMQALSLAGLDTGVTSVYINLAPWCVNIGGAKIGRRLIGGCPEYNSVMAYFDAGLLASKIANANIEADCGLGDYTCPPSGEMAMFNSLKTTGKVRFVFNQNKSHTSSASGATQYIVTK